MASAARSRGLQYFAIAEHSKRLTITGGFSAEALLYQLDRIDQLNTELDGFAKLKGVEVNILRDGSLDISNDVLRHLDLVVGAIHSGFGLTQEK